MGSRTFVPQTMAYNHVGREGFLTVVVNWHSCHNLTFERGLLQSRRPLLNVERLSAIQMSRVDRCDGW